MLVLTCAGCAAAACGGLRRAATAAGRTGVVPADNCCHRCASSLSQGLITVIPLSSEHWACFDMTTFRIPPLCITRIRRLSILSSSPKDQHVRRLYTLCVVTQRPNLCEGLHGDQSPVGGDAVTPAGPADDDSGNDAVGKPEDEAMQEEPSNVAAPLQACSCTSLASLKLMRVPVMDGAARLVPIG